MASEFRLARSHRCIEGADLRFRVVYLGRRRCLEYVVDLKDFPPNLIIQRVPDLHHRRRDVNLTGDVDFDDLFQISAERAHESQVFLSKARRQLLLKALSPFPEARIERATLKGIFPFNKAALRQRVSACIELRDHLIQGKGVELPPAGWVNRRKRAAFSQKLLVLGILWLLLSWKLPLLLAPLLKGFEPSPLFFKVALAAGGLQVLGGMLAGLALPGRRTLAGLCLAGFYLPVAVLGLEAQREGRPFIAYGALLTGLLYVVYLMMAGDGMRKSRTRDATNSVQY